MVLVSLSLTFSGVLEDRIDYKQICKYILFYNRTNRPMVKPNVISSDELKSLYIRATEDKEVSDTTMFHTFKDSLISRGVRVVK